MYTVKLKEFQGPLDLLLQLTEEKKLDIIEISLAKVTNQYLTYLRNLEKISLEDLVNFLAIASRLILIKSRILLPSLELTEEEEEDIEALKRQLDEYKKFKELAKKIEEIVEGRNIAYGREKYQGLKPIFYPPKNYKLKNSNEDKIRKIQEELSKKIQTTFQDITKKTESKVDIIISFLALLELVKQKIVNTKQDGLYDKIIIRKQKTGI